MSPKCLLSLVLVTADLSPAVGEVLYRVMRLEAQRTPWVAATRATDISENEWITGLSYNGPGSPSYNTVFSYHPTTGYVDLGNMPGTATGGYGINTLGQISGTARAVDRDIAFRYTPGVGYQDLGGLGGAEGARADDINSHGQVIGDAHLADGNIHGFLYTDGRGMEDLGHLGGNYSLAAGINDSGWVSGSSTVADGTSHVFLYRDGIGMIDLGAGIGTALNNVGVVGGVTYAGQPMLFIEGEAPMPISGPPGLYYVADVNDQNVLVGGITFNDGIMRAYVATKADGVALLNDLIPEDAGWDLYCATAINNQGQIVGEGWLEGFGVAAYRLDPIPEPSTLALLALAAGIFWLRARRN